MLCPQSPQYARDPLAGQEPGAFAKPLLRKVGRPSRLEAKPDAPFRTSAARADSTTQAALGRPPGFGESSAAQIPRSASGR